MRNPYKSTVFWAWNKDMKEEEIVHQIADMAKHGIGGFFIHARAGLSIPYMSDEWFHAVKISLAAAKEYDLDVWLYDEDGWPSGFAGGKIPAMGDEYCLKRLACSDNVEKADKSHILARYTKGRDGEYALDERGTDLTVYYETDKHYSDLMSHKAVRAFIQETHEVYKEKVGQYFGSVIQGVFTDEPQLSWSDAWSFSLEEAYRAEYGEELLPQLWKLFQGERYPEFRYRLNYLRGQLFEKNYIGQIGDWCEKNGLLFTGHLPGEDGLCSSALLTGGTIRNYRHMHIPGIDFLGKRLTSPVLLKQLQAARGQFGKKFLLSETFGCCGWNASFSDYAWLWAYQAAFGVNMPCLHLGAYSITGCRKRDYPAFFSYHEPWWEQFGFLNRWMYSLNHFLSDVQYSADVLVVVPSADVGAYAPYANKARNVSNQFRILVSSLIECQVGFDLGDETVMRSMARVEGGKVVIGGGSYRTVIVPETESLLQSTYETLRKFAAEGGNVVFTNSVPVKADFERAANISGIDEKTVVMNRADLWQKYFRDTGYDRDVYVTGETERIFPKELVVFCGRRRNDRACFIVNTSACSEKHVVIHFAGPGQIYLYEPSENRKSAVNTVCCGRESCALVSIPEKSCCCYILEKAHGVPVPVLQTARLLSVGSVEVGENSIALDQAAFSIDGEPFSKEMPTIKLHEAVYASSSNKRRRLWVRYRFYSEVANAEMGLFVENSAGQRVFVNGAEVAPTDEWWLDREMRRYPISKLVKTGNNEIIVENILLPKQINFEMDKFFETEKNRFSYPTEIESVYICGNFDVNYTGEQERMLNCYSLFGGVFHLVPATKKQANADLTAQNLWFYRGTARLRLSVERTRSVQKLRLRKVSAATVALYVNGKYCHTFVETNKSCNLSDYLHEGYNELELVLYSSNRNVLGPHHHIKGEVDFVGGNTFKGIKGFEDSILNPALPADTWTDRYSFVPFGIGEIWLEEWK